MGRISDLDATLSVYRVDTSSPWWVPAEFGSRENPCQGTQAMGLLGVIEKSGREAGFIIEGPDAEEAEVRVRELLREPLDRHEFQKACGAYLYGPGVPLPPLPSEPPPSFQELADGYLKAWGLEDSVKEAQRREAATKAARTPDEFAREWKPWTPPTLQTQSQQSPQAQRQQAPWKESFWT